MIIGLGITQLLTAADTTNGHHGPTRHKREKPRKRLKAYGVMI
jgi:hypothetical protein